MEKKEEALFNYLLPLLITSLIIMAGVFLFLNFLLDKLKRINITANNFLKLLEERKYSLDGKEKFSLLRLEKVSVVLENEDKKMFKIKGKMIIKNKKIMAIDFVSWMPISQIILLKKYGFFPAEFDRQRKFGFVWWRVMLIMAVLIAVYIFICVAILFPDRLWMPISLT